jgi:pimeloyl-ACP methyl ester carboxylesterase
MAASKTLVVVAGFTAAAALTDLAVYASKASELVHMPRFSVSAETEAKAIADLPKLEDVALRTSDGLKLRAWFSPGDRRAVVIMVSGGAGNRGQLLPEATALSRHGYGVFLYDSRASGQSDGNLVTWGDREQLDVTAAIDYVSSRPEIDARRIAVLGHSIGASSVVMTAARDPRANAVILYATWTSLADEIDAKYGRLGFLSSKATLLGMRLYGVNPDNIRPLDVIAKISPRPLLMITGTLDGDTPVPVMQRLFDAAREPKSFWIVPGAGHGTYFEVAPVEYETRVTSFLDHALFPQLASP